MIQASDINLDSQILFSLYGFPINTTLFGTWIVMLVLLALSVLTTRKLTPNKMPSRLQVIMEMLVTTLCGQIHDVSGDKPLKYMSLIGTFFLFIATANLLTIFSLVRPSNGKSLHNRSICFCRVYSNPLLWHSKCRH